MRRLTLYACRSGDDQAHDYVWLEKQASRKAGAPLDVAEFMEWFGRPAPEPGQCCRIELTAKISKDEPMEADDGCDTD